MQEFQQGSILGPLFSLIYINNVADELSYHAILFADDTLLFSMVHNTDSSAAELINDLAKKSHWAHQWKMSFDPDPCKQVWRLFSAGKLIKTLILLCLLMTI